MPTHLSTSTKKCCRTHKNRHDGKEVQVLAVLLLQLAHEGRGLPAGDLVVGQRPVDVDVGLVLAEVGEVQRRQGEDGAHQVLAADGHLDRRRPHHVAHGLVAAQRGVGVGGEVVQELEVQQVYPGRRGRCCYCCCCCISVMIVVIVVMIREVV